MQVGWDSPLVLTTVSAADARFLRSLEGGRQVGAAERRRHSGLLNRLAAHGLMVNDASPDAPICVRLHGAGALGTEAAIAMARVGLALTVVDHSRARYDAAPHLPDPDCGAAAHARVRAAVPRAQLRGAHADAAIDVIISAGPAVARARELLAANQPHLLVECGESTVRVGPLVVPGENACAICLGLAATAVRPEWPVLALQCDSRRPRVDPVVATIAGGLVAHEVRAFLAGRTTTTWLVDPHGVAAVAPTAPHPECRCTDADVACGA